MSLHKPLGDGADFNKIAAAIIMQFENYSKTLRPQEVVRIVRKASTIGVRSQRLWQKLYTEVVSSWDDYTMYDKLSMLDLFSQQAVDVSKEMKTLLGSLH